MRPSNDENRKPEPEQDEPIYLEDNEWGHHTNLAGMQGGDREPTRQELLRSYDVKITFVDSGCIVNVGCRNVAFTTTEEAVDAVNKYIANPKEELEKWNKKFNK